MSTMKTQREFGKFPRLGLILLLAGMMAVASPQVLAQAGPNPELQTKVASKLSHDHLLQGQKIMVNTNGSQVTLSGTVKTTQQWQQAESVTANVSGVRTILNNLTIAGQNGESQHGQPQNDATPNYDQGGQMAPPPPPDAQQPQAPPSPASPSNGMNDAGNPPPPPPDQQGSRNQQTSRNQQGYTQPSRPQYPASGDQGNGYAGQSYGAGYGAQQNQGYNQYGNQNRYAPPQQQPSGPVAVPAGALLQIRTVEPLDGAQLQPGQTFDTTVASDVWEGNVLAIPRGAMLQGEVVQAVQPKGKLRGKPYLNLRLTALNLGGQVYRLETTVWSGVGPNKAGSTAGNTITGGLLGAIVGGIIGRGPGAAVGAGLGAVTGLGVSSATTGPRIYIPAEAVLNFHLAEPVTVQPVSWEEARRMASNVPQLQARPRYERYPRPYPYAYAYPPPYGYRAYPYYGPNYYFGLGW